jgi:hypothetical protein
MKRRLVIGREALQYLERRRKERVRDADALPLLIRNSAAADAVFELLHYRVEGEALGNSVDTHLMRRIPARRRIRMGRLLAG